MMSEWTGEEKRKFRAKVLEVLAGRHLSQRSRMDDVELLRMLQTLAVEADLKDVTTIVQEMSGRGWVKYKDRRNPTTRRVELYEIEICGEGQDLVDDTTRHPAVNFE